MPRELHELCLHDVIVYAHIRRWAQDPHLSLSQTVQEVIAALKSQTLGWAEECGIVDKLDADNRALQWLSPSASTQQPRDFLYWDELWSLLVAYDQHRAYREICFRKHLFNSPMTIVLPLEDIR